MRRLSDTLAHLAALRAMARSRPQQPGTAGRLRKLEAFSPNPGSLGAWSYAPAGLAPGAALVVVLHGCTQTAADYDSGTGWSRLAEEHGFALLFPEQSRANNANLCFNWFEPGDIARDQGEVRSIRSMIDAMLRSHRIDPDRLYVTGLSAGGAMAAALLAAYPEVFAGGAIVAGLPHGTATGVPQALERMRGTGLPKREALATLARNASDHEGPWPTVQIWHGADDRIVHPANGEALIQQWGALHGVKAAPDRQERIGAHLRRVWLDKEGRAAIEHYSIDGMGHGVPLTAEGAEALGAIGPYMLEAGIGSTRRIAAAWGLAELRAAERATPTRDAPPPLPPPRAAAGVGRIIENALRSAGLMR